MSKVFICAAIPDELATREEGAVAVATDPTHVIWTQA
ncbi:ExoO exonuclease VIII, ds DNA exonuclease encoded by prophage CP-933O [Escherichia coli]|nr:ExoO exonuclease VIII, ds DNA exonuclease encoded by prophage CP-933O [Escherichia coli]